MKTSMNRRAFLRGAAALGVAAHADMAGAAQEASPGRGSFPLPARGEFVIRGAYVMTMDPTLGDIPRGDVHVKNGAIVAVGAGLKAGGAQVLDGRDMIVLPGFVDTHWHMWNTLLRSMAGDKRELGYFPTVATLGKLFTPGDMYQGTRLAGRGSPSSVSGASISRPQCGQTGMATDSSPGRGGTGPMTTPIVRGDSREGQHNSSAGSDGDLVTRDCKPG